MPSQYEPSPASFFLSGGQDGLLLIHGFTGSASSMSLLAPYLNERGLTVSAALLPGHGTIPEDLNQKTWRDWVDYTARLLAELQKECEHIFVGGQSLGALLALYLAANQANVSGVIAYSPAIKVTDPRARLLAILKYFVKTIPKPEDNFTDPTAGDRLWNYDVYPVAAAHETMKFISVVTAALPQITCPALIISSTKDDTIHPQAAQFTYDQIGSVDKELSEVHNSGHVLTLDTEWQKIAEMTYKFIQNHS